MGMQRNPISSQPRLWNGWAPKALHSGEANGKGKAKAPWQKRLFPSHYAQDGHSGTERPRPSQGSPAFPIRAKGGTRRSTLRHPGGTLSRLPVLFSVLSKAGKARDTVKVAGSNPQAEGNKREPYPEGSFEGGMARRAGGRIHWREGTALGDTHLIPKPTAGQGAGIA